MDPLNASSQALVVPLHERGAFLAAQERRSHNEAEFEVTANVRGLSAGVYQATEHAVFVFSADISVLADWLFEMDGYVTTYDDGSGITVWMLHTKTDVDPGRVACPVQVTVPLVTGEPVMSEIAAAVAA